MLITTEIKKYSQAYDLLSDLGEYDICKLIEYKLNQKICELSKKMTRKEFIDFIDGVRE